jgi:hypothetical protein
MRAGLPEDGGLGAPGDVVDKNDMEGIHPGKAQECAQLDGVLRPLHPLGEVIAADNN